MGLEMYAFTAPRHAITKEVDFDRGSLPEVSELHDWWKHPNLHGWMANLYYAKRGARREFNCATVILTLDDLASLEDAILNDCLPVTCGFFFGQSDGDEKDDDLEFIAKARAAIASGLAVFYDSWW
ncbi:hypothetical protein [Novosphingobium album (ex Liu et al. 2023)]|uniref:Phosphoglycerate kinase n=1 Tax=Novosphingobium album (ex Liu et al. 2023) TaxID=3031130 RepID=A0ABT5WX91_9SPHN|nr:hypothetical protein [Novosphingobium album (ex Liu et al. 2023)]MDE8654487.1 hypothetical protein [Novosphingobium album (ex Liu et al. 2023)]